MRRHQMCLWGKFSGPQNILLQKWFSHQKWFKRGKVCFSMTSILLHLLLTGYLLFPPGQCLFTLQIPIQCDLLCFVGSDPAARDSNLGTLVPEPTLLTVMHNNQYGKKHTNKDIIWCNSSYNRHISKAQRGLRGRSTWFSWESHGRFQRQWTECLSWLLKEQVCHVDEVGREFQAERTATAKAKRKERESFS